MQELLTRELTALERSRDPVGKATPRPMLNYAPMRASPAATGQVSGSASQPGTSLSPMGQPLGLDHHKTLAARIFP